MQLRIPPLAIDCLTPPDQVGGDIDLPILIIERSNLSRTRCVRGVSWQQITNLARCKVPLLWDATEEPVVQPAVDEGWYADAAPTPPPATMSEPDENVEAAPGGSVPMHSLSHLAMASGTVASAQPLASGCRFAAMSGDRRLAADLISSRRASTACIVKRFVCLVQ